MRVYPPRDTVRILKQAALDHGTRMSKIVTELADQRLATNAKPVTDSSTVAPYKFWRTSPILLIVTLLALWRVGLAVFLPYDRFISLFDDDAFYYFGIARNIAAGRGSTFNGIDLTNGYHPAWLAAIEPVFFVFHGRSALVGVTILSCLMFIALGIMLQRISVLVGSSRTVLIAGSPLVVLGVIGPSYFFSGMETGLVILAIVATGILFVQTSGLSAGSASWKNAGILGLAMTIAIAARLDSVILMALLFAFTLYRWRAKLPFALAAGSIPLAFLASYMLINLAIFRTFSPVSGQAKAAGGGTNFQVLEQFFAAPKLFGVDLFLGSAAAPIAVFALVLASRKYGFRDAPSAMFGSIVYCGSLSTVLYYGFTSSWQLWPWYFYGIPLALLFSGIVLVGRASDGRPRAVSIVSALSIVSVLSLALVWTQGRLNSTNSGASFVATAPTVARIIDEIEPADAPLAVGDRAGSLGFHLQRPTVQLEGLVNSKEYLDALENHKVNRFLNSRDVSLYARVDSVPGEKLNGSNGVRRFTEPQQGNGPKTEIYVRDDDLLLTLPLPDGTSYRVWRYRPDLNNG
jgi:hypothetical protein